MKVCFLLLALLCSPLGRRTTHQDLLRPRLPPKPIGPPPIAAAALPPFAHAPPIGRDLPPPIVTSSSSEPEIINLNMSPLARANVPRFEPSTDGSSLPARQAFEPPSLDPPSTQAAPVGSPQLTSETPPRRVPAASPKRTPRLARGDLSWRDLQGSPERRPEAKTPQALPSRRPPRPENANRQKVPQPRMQEEVPVQEEETSEGSVAPGHVKRLASLFQGGQGATTPVNQPSRGARSPSPAARQFHTQGAPAANSGPPQRPVQKASPRRIPSPEPQQIQPPPLAKATASTKTLEAAVGPPQGVPFQAPLKAPPSRSPKQVQPSVLPKAAPQAAASSSAASSSTLAPPAPSAPQIWPMDWQKGVGERALLSEEELETYTDYTKANGLFPLIPEGEDTYDKHKVHMEIPNLWSPPGMRDVFNLPFFTAMPKYDFKAIYDRPASEMQGGFGTVVKVKGTSLDNPTDVRWFAVKVSVAEKNGRDVSDILLAEAEFATELSRHPHPYVVQLPLWYALHQPTTDRLLAVLLIMEASSGEELLTATTSSLPMWRGSMLRFSGEPLELYELGLRAIVERTLVALAHMHSIGTLHCDLKPDNILLSQSKPWNVYTGFKVIDIGLAWKFNPSVDPHTLQHLSKRGTPGYICPVLQHSSSSLVTVRGKERYCSSVMPCVNDLHTVGATMWALLHREQPLLSGRTPTFQHRSDVHFAEYRLSDLGGDFLRLSYGQSPEYAAANGGPGYFVHVTEALNHPWFTASRDTLVRQVYRNLWDDAKVQSSIINPAPGSTLDSSQRKFNQMVNSDVSKARAEPFKVIPAADLATLRAMPMGG